jgi:beta-phosphoglucomutase family hydrolase
MIQIPEDVQGLVFDCDGTIADTMPLHYVAWVEALGKHGYEFSEALFYEMAGIPSRKIVEILNERHGWTLDAQALADFKESLYVEQLHKVTPIEPVVRIVKEYAGKLPMAVATGATRAICAKTLAAMEVVEYFQAIVTADDVEHGKPAPDIFLEAAKRIGVPPEKCYAFEDGELGLQAARAAGMVAVDIRPMRKV